MHGGLNAVDTQFALFFSIYHSQLFTPSSHFLWQLTIPTIASYPEMTEKVKQLRRPK
jgi:hypothetical protein